MEGERRGVGWYSVEEVERWGGVGGGGGEGGSGGGGDSTKEPQAATHTGTQHSDDSHQL